MVRCDICKTPEFVDRLTKMCEKDPHTYSEMRRIAEYYQKHREISPLSGDAAKVLMREKDPEIEAKGLEAVAKNISNGNVPTAKQVKTIIENKRAGVKPGGRIQIHAGGPQGPVRVPEPAIVLPPIGDDRYIPAPEDIDVSEDYYSGDTPITPDEQEKLEDDDVQNQPVASMVPKVEKTDIAIPANVLDIADKMDNARVAQATKDLKTAKEDERERNEIAEKNENTKNRDALVSVLKDAMRSALHKGITRKEVFEALHSAIDSVFEPIESNGERKSNGSELASGGLYK